MFFASNDAHILSLLIAIPFFGFFFISQIKPHLTKNLINCSLLILLFSFIIIFILFLAIENATDRLQFFEKYYLIPQYVINLTVGVERISVIFLLLSTFSFIPAVVFCIEQENNIKRTILILLGIFLFTIIAFCSVNIFLFYAFSEATFFSFLLMAKSENLNKKTYFSPVGIVIIISSILFFIFFLMLSNYYDSIMIGVSSSNAGISNIFCSILLAALLLRANIVISTKFISETATYLPLYTLFFTVLGLLYTYSVFRFLPLATFSKTASIVILVVSFLIFLKTTLNIKRLKETGAFLLIIPYIMQITFVQIILSMLCNLQIQNISLILINYILSTSGIFFYFFIRNKTLGSFNKFLDILFLYFSVSLVGIPGTLGFYNHYILCSTLLKQYNSFILICYSFLFIIEIFFLIKIIHVAILRKELQDEEEINSMVDILNKSEQKENIEYINFAFVLIIIVFLSLFAFNINPNFIFKILPRV
jgi:NADH-quinone oxidoreductase subunit M